MARRFLTLNIGASKAVLAEYSLTGKHDIRLVNYGMGDMPPVDNDLLGSMETALTPVLHSIMRETGIKPGPVNVSMSGQMVFPRFVKLPPVETSKLEQMIRYEVEQNVPFPMDDIVWDKQFTGSSDMGEATAVIVAAKIEHVRGVTDAVVSAGLSPEIIDIAPMAVCNAFRWNYPDLGGCTLMLDIGARTTNLVLSEEGKIYCRSIPVAGNAITKEIAQTFGCSQQEAEAFKLEHAYVSLGGMEEDPDEAIDRLAKTVRGVMNRLNAEISRSVNFYRSQQGGNAPDRVVLTGGTARMPYLDRFFEEVLQIETMFLDPFRQTSSAVDAERIAADSFVLAESVGLALREGDSAHMTLNLLPPEIVEARKTRKRLPLLVAGSLALAAGIATSIAGMKKSEGASKVAGDLYQRRLAEVSAAKVEASNAETSLAQAYSKEIETAELFASRTAALRALSAIERSIAEVAAGQNGVMWIHSWKTNQDGGGAEIVIRAWCDRAAKLRKEKGIKENFDKVLCAAIAKHSGIVSGVDYRTTSYVKGVDRRGNRDVDVLMEIPITVTFAPAFPKEPESGEAGAASEDGGDE